MDEHSQPRTQQPAAVAFNHRIFLQVWGSVLQRDEARQMRIWSHFLFCIWLRRTSPYLLQLSWDECCNTVLLWSSRNVHYKPSLYFSSAWWWAWHNAFFFFFLHFCRTHPKGLYFFFSEMCLWERIIHSEDENRLEERDLHSIWRNHLRTGNKVKMLSPWNVRLRTRYILMGVRCWSLPKLLYCYHSRRCTADLFSL